jgi:integrase
LPKSANVQQSVRQFFNHAKDRDLISGDNKFARTGASKSKRRVERPDFEIVTDEQYERILQCARTCRADDYTVVVEGIVLCVGEGAIRPSEIFALHKDSVDLAADVIEVRWQIDSRTRERVPVKDEDVRLVVPSPRLRAHLELILREPRTILFPAVRGGYMTRPNWYVYWNAVRASAGLPGLEFYELKHRALQWMIDPVDDGGLGLDHATAAEMAGHADGGWLIANVYTKLSQRRALDRARRAMREYAARHPAEEGNRPAAPRSPSRSATVDDQRRVAVTAATLITYAEAKPKTSVAGWTAGGTATCREHDGLDVHVSIS